MSSLLAGAGIPSGVRGLLYLHNITALCAVPLAAVSVSLGVDTARRGNRMNG